MASVKEQHHAALDQPSTHGMLIFGDGPVYLSHLPMFHQPHDYQVLLEVDFVKPGADPLATYVEDRHVTGEKVYTLVPEKLSLPELFSGVRTSFKATLVRGHFERGGSPFLTNVTVNVKRVVFQKKFDPMAGALPESRYIVFGDAHQLFAAHMIQKAPDFDHVVSIRLAEGIPDEATAVAIRAGSLVAFSGVQNNAEHALAEGTDHEAVLTTPNGANLAVKLQALTSFYLETGDLAE